MNAMMVGRPNLEVFADALLALAEHDADVLVVTSDSRGSGKLGPFGKALPDQIVEMGIAEQNLVGVASGLSMTGKKVFAVSSACFLTARALEQIKNDVAYSGHPVKVIGISAGVSYGALGTTHHSLHDYAVMRAINNIDIVAPADNFEAAEVIKAAITHPRPVYTHRYGNNARIDTLVQNGLADATETAADAFLNWVRHRERATFKDAAGESQAAGWISFFAANMGMFLRNAVIYRLGMVQHYQAAGIIPQTPTAISTNFATNYTLRLAPQEVDATAFSSSSNLPGSIPIYGWLDAGGTLGDGISTYWLLIADGLNRLLWIASGGITHNENQVKSQAQLSSATLMHLHPARNYNNADLSTIIGA